MSANLHKTKRRIASVNSTKKITKAMELVATVKLKKYKNTMLSASLFSANIRDVVDALLFKEKDDVDNPYFKSNDAAENLVIVINSNLGLCAGFNNDIYRYVINNVSPENNTLLIIGLKGEHFESEGYKLCEDFVSLNEHIFFSDIATLSNFIQDSFVSKKFNRISLVYTHYVNSIKFVPNQMQILPILADVDKPESGYGPIYDQDASTMLDELLPSYISSLLYDKVIESQVSEQASRRTAMENATDNADDLIDQLTIEYNKARQAAITAEISEVVSSSFK